MPGTPDTDGAAVSALATRRCGRSVLVAFVDRTRNRVDLHSAVVPLVCQADAPAHQVVGAVLVVKGADSHLLRGDRDVGPAPVTVIGEGPTEIDALRDLAELLRITG